MIPLSLAKPKSAWHQKRSYSASHWIMVGMLLCILALVIFDRSGSARADARLSSVKSTLQILRTQMELYKATHHDAPPMQGQLWNQLVNPTNANGATSAVASPAYPLGPFLQAIPVNPINGQATASDTAASNVGWVYIVQGANYTLRAVNPTGDGVLTY